MKPVEAAYLAGLIDGEGSIYLERFKAARSKTQLRRNLTPWQYRICVYLLMCDKAAIEFAANLTDRHIQVRKLPMKYNDSSFRRKLTAYCIVWRNSFAERLLRAILPYLHGKRQKAVLCLRFQDKYAPGRGRPFKKRLIPTYEALRKKIAAA